MKTETDVVIVGTGAAGLFCALNLPRDTRIIMLTKSDLESSDSFLAQGGICMLRDEADYQSYFEDTLRAGHYENDRKSVEIMIRASRQVAEQGLPERKRLLGAGRRLPEMRLPVAEQGLPEQGLLRRSFFIRGKGRIRSRGSCITRILPGRRSPAGCWSR